MYEETIYGAGCVGACINQYIYIYVYILHSGVQSGVAVSIPVAYRLCRCLYVDTWATMQIYNDIQLCTCKYIYIYTCAHQLPQRNLVVGQGQALVVAVD